MCSTNHQYWFLFCEAVSCIGRKLWTCTELGCSVGGACLYMCGYVMLLTCLLPNALSPSTFLYSLYKKSAPYIKCGLWSYWHVPLTVSIKIANMLHSTFVFSTSSRLRYVCHIYFNLLLKNTQIIIIIWLNWMLIRNTVEFILCLLEFCSGLAENKVSGKVRPS